MPRIAGVRALGVAVAFLGGLAMAPAAQASLIGTSATVTFVEPGFPDAVTVVTVGAGPEITPGDASAIGDDILLDGEFIDLDAFTLTYRVRGDGDPVPGSPGFFTTGFDPAAMYVFSDLTFGPTPFRIIDVGIGLANVIGVALGPQVTFTDTSVSLVIGTLGVGEVPGGFDLGTITLSLRVEPIGPVQAVPEPSALAVLAFGLMVVGWRHRGRC